jgi:predicted enzyme related to lactoylglutathione lyase
MGHDEGGSEEKQGWASPGFSTQVRALARTWGTPTGMWVEKPSFLGRIFLSLLRKDIYCRETILVGGCMASITGFGGIFLRANDAKALYAWYERHLGLVKSEGAYGFPAPTQHPQVVFALFKQDDAYFPPAQKAMINLQVDDLDGLLDRLVAEGVAVDPKRETYDFGKFGWVTDPEGNRVEIWQPITSE